MAGCPSGGTVLTDPQDNCLWYPDSHTWSCLPITPEYAADTIHSSLSNILASPSLSIVQWIQHVSKKMNGYQVELYSPSLLPFPLWLHSVCGPVPLGFLRLANTWPSISVTGSGSSVSKQWKPGVHLAQRWSEMRCMYALLLRIRHNSQSSDCHRGQKWAMLSCPSQINQQTRFSCPSEIPCDIPCQNQRCLSNCPVSCMGLLFGAIAHIAVVVERFWTQDEQFRSVGTNFQMYRWISSMHWLASDDLTNQFLPWWAFLVNHFNLQRVTFHLGKPVAPVTKPTCSVNDFFSRLDLCFTMWEFTAACCAPQVIIRQPES